MSGTDPPGWFDGPVPKENRRRPMAELLTELAARTGDPMWAVLPSPSDVRRSQAERRRADRAERLERDRIAREARRRATTIDYGGSRG